MLHNFGTGILLGPTLFTKLHAFLCHIIGHKPSADQAAVLVVMLLLCVKDTIPFIDRSILLHVYLTSVGNERNTFGDTLLVPILGSEHLVSYEWVGN